MGELSPNLTVEEYETRRDDLARQLLVERVEHDCDPTDAIEINLDLLGTFHEEYPISVIKYADTDPTHRDIIGLTEGNGVQGPLENLVQHARATLAHDIANYIERTLAEEEGLVDLNPDTGIASLTDKGRDSLP